MPPFTTLLPIVTTSAAKVAKKPRVFVVWLPDNDPSTSTADTKDAVYELFYYSIGTLISPCATEIYAILVFMPANSSLVVALMESRDLSALVVQLKIAKSL